VEISGASVTVRSCHCSQSVTTDIKCRHSKGDWLGRDVWGEGRRGEEVIECTGSKD